MLTDNGGSVHLARVPNARDRIHSTPLWYFVNERHRIYLRKQAGEAYLTDDPILGKYRFCNVFRELDRVTVWVRKNIREPYADHPNLWLMLAIARTINWPPTLQEIIDRGAWPVNEGWEPETLTAVLEARSAAGHKVYTGAYMIRAESDPKKPWYRWSKQRYIAEVVIGRLWEDRARGRAPLADPERTLRSVWLAFRSPRYVGWGGGGFMAYEVVTDMRHTCYPCDAPDILTWANAGPGALRGLNRLLGRDLKATVKDRAVALMRELLAEQDARRAEWVPPMEMRDVEHSLCECDKYLRTANGEGKPRSRYVRGRGW